MQRHRKMLVVAVLCVLATSCADDRVRLERGPLGPARYEVQVKAAGDVANIRERHTAALRVEPRGRGAAFTLRTTTGDVVQAELQILPGGGVDLQAVRGASVAGSGQTELASLVGQLNPPLPLQPVRIGDRWSSTQHITTHSLLASFRTELSILRFRRIASADAAELAGTVGGNLSVVEPSRVLEGNLRGRTDIVWDVHAGHVVAAETNLVWTLQDGSVVTLETRIQPR